MDIQIARVIRYYDKTGIAIIEVFAEPLKLGDVVRIAGPLRDFTQTITWLQMEYAQVSEVPVDETAALRTTQPVDIGDILYLVTKK